MSDTHRDEMNVDALFVGAGPANLAGAIHLANLVRAHNEAVAKGERAGEPLAPEIMVLEKAAAPGNHNLSGAVMDPKGFRELFGADTPIPGGQPVTRDGFRMLTRESAFRIWPLPPLLSNAGNVIVSVSQLTRFMAERAEATGMVTILPGFAAAEALVQDGRVRGVRTRDSGIDRHGERRANFEPGADLLARATVVGEGTRGSIARQLEAKLGIQDGRDPQTYGLGIKEVWKVRPEKHRPGEVWHTLGWPLSAKNQVGGGWIYHMADGLVSLGLVVRLDYSDALLDPFEEFQRQKLHPWIADLLSGGEMVEYGAKSIPEGGWHSIPRMHVPGALLVGDSAGLVNGFKLKGIHYAIKSGMLAAEAIFAALRLPPGREDEALARYPRAVLDSYVGRELYKVRNFHSALSGDLALTMIKVGALIATGGHLLLGRRHVVPDGTTLRDQTKTILPQLSEADRELPKDNPLIFDRATALYYSDTAHEENQPSHLVVHDLDLCATRCIHEYGSPCQRFCPAEVYEISRDDAGQARLILHPSNCVHCKTCDIKDPYENILWVVPEPTGGPQYKRT